MVAGLGAKLNLGTALEPVLYYLLRPVRLFKEYRLENLRYDIIAALTVTVILLPQGIAYALIAELPPERGLYAAIVAAVVAALWGSSDQINTGPTNTMSLLILSALLTVSNPGSPDFVLAAGLMSVMAGFLQMVLGLARLGVLVNFVSHSVIVGFASGAGLLIAFKQMRILLGMEFSSHNLLETFEGLATHIAETHPPTAVLGIGTIIFIITVKKINPRLPSALLSMMAASLAVFILGLDKEGVSVIGELPRGLPPLATNLPLFDIEFIGRMSTGALAVAAIGLVETVAISRSIATQTGQRLDSNQEFVGQGLANIAAGLFSGFATSGSFTRSAVNHSAGARTPMAAIFSSIFVLIAMLVLAPAAAYLPHTALAGLLITVAYGMIDREEIGRIWQGSRGDALIMMATFLATLFLEIEFAVLLGILLSFARYIIRTSTPRVHPVLPDDEFHHFHYQPDKPACPQLGIIDILGDLYFGAVNHIEEQIHHHIAENPDQRYLLIRMHNVNNCDFSGIHMLETVVRMFRERGGDVFMVRVGFQVDKVMISTGFCDHLGGGNFLSEDRAIAHLFHRVLDPAVCIYECPVRVFKECQNLPKHFYPQAVALYRGNEQMAAIKEISPRELRERLLNGEPQPAVIDVREPREYLRGHIPAAELNPLPKMFVRPVELPKDRLVVFVCRSGRRSRLAAQIMQDKGYENVQMLSGGMLAWQAAGLLEAIGS